MAHDTNLRSECERLYVDELLSPAEICERTGVALASFYRWKKVGGWEEGRENSLGMRDKLGRLLNKMIDAGLVEGQDPSDQRLHALLNMYERYVRTGAAREKVIEIGDAEMLLETMREIPTLKSLLEDPEILDDLGKRLKEKLR